MKPIVKTPTRLWPKGQVWAEYNEIIPAGTPLSTVMSRNYWVHVEGRLKPLDVITCVAADGTFDVDIRLLSKTPTEMRFSLIRGGEHKEPRPVKSETGERYAIQSDGRTGNWNIREKKTGKVVASGLDREAADAEKVKLEEAA
jgi:hypothetical protein